MEKINKNVPWGDEINSFIPPILAKIVNHCNELQPNLNKSTILNILLFKIAEMLTCKRITIDECGKINIPNWYAMILVESGGGKDRILKIMNEFLFKEFYDWFERESQTLYEKQMQEYEAEKISKTVDVEAKPELRLVKGGNTNDNINAPF